MSKVLSGWETYNNILIINRIHIYKYSTLCYYVIYAEHTVCRLSKAVLILLTSESHPAVLHP